MNEQNVQQNAEKRKRVFSAIKPSGNPTLGNYLGAMKYWGDMGKAADALFAVADLHAITVAIEPKDLRENCKRLFALLIAVGIDTERDILFLQSHVPAHAELSWLLNNYTMFGEASRMTQFKDKSKKAPDNINVGLFDYPVLMAADILLYQADIVPVGEDQLQHVELCRTIANRFNNRYSPTFTVPVGKVPTYGARIYSLSDPTAKMGKSEGEGDGTVFLLDTPDVIMRKFKRAVTDCDTCVKASEDKPGITNLLTIYAAVNDITVEQAEKEFEHSSYAEFKTRVGEATVEALRPIREKYEKLRSDDNALCELMKSGASKAAYLARKTLEKVYKKIGFVRI
ncbi:MAG: tryptophan--tRNA ligase [Clostridiales bacterium]|nr:tryptophan--tRNA ligase [Clostridiales bacterium]